MSFLRMLFLWVDLDDDLEPTLHTQGTQPLIILRALSSTVGLKGPHLPESFVPLWGSQSDAGFQRHSRSHAAIRMRATVSPASPIPPVALKAPWTPRAMAGGVDWVPSGVVTLAGSSRTGQGGGSRDRCSSWLVGSCPRTCPFFPFHLPQAWGVGGGGRGGEGLWVLVVCQSLLGPD